MNFMKKTPTECLEMGKNLMMPFRHSPQYVTSISVVSRLDSLHSLSSSADVTSENYTEDSEEEENVEAVNDEIELRINSYIVEVNNQFVANIQIGSLSLDRQNEK